MKLYNIKYPLLIIFLWVILTFITILLLITIVNTLFNYSLSELSNNQIIGYVITIFFFIVEVLFIIYIIRNKFSHIPALEIIENEMIYRKFRFFPLKDKIINISLKDILGFESSYNKAYGSYSLLSIENLIIHISDSGPTFKGMYPKSLYIRNYFGIDGKELVEDLNQLLVYKNYTSFVENVHNLAAIKSNRNFMKCFTIIFIISVLIVSFMIFQILYRT